MPEISVVIITHNEEANIQRCLDSVQGIATEVVVVDSFSTDNTVAICESSGCRVYHREFTGYGNQKQFATNQASNDWILSIDADEVVSAELREEIYEWKQDAGCSLPAEQAGMQDSGYRIPFSLCFMGRILKHSGVGNEFHLRFFDRNRGNFTQVQVHEGVELRGNTGTFKGRIIHYSYRNIIHHLEKTNIYTTQAAAENVSKGKKYSKCWVGFKFPISFFTIYILKGGILDGYPGFIWSFFTAFYASLKIAKTIELSAS
jgi:glycosyltransferase involved in cell wall biosynthesis